MPLSFLPSVTSLWCTILLLLLSPLLWIHHLIAAPPLSLPWSFSPRYPVPRHHQRLYKVTFMLCSMLKWSVRHAKTYSMCGLRWQKAPSGLRKKKQSWRKTMTMKACANWKREQKMLERMFDGLL